MWDERHEVDWRDIDGGVIRDRSLATWLDELAGEDEVLRREAEGVLRGVYRENGMTAAGAILIPYLQELFHTGAIESRRSALRLLASAWSSQPDFGDDELAPAAAFTRWSEAQQMIRHRFDDVYAVLAHKHIDHAVDVIRALARYEEQASAHSPVLREVYNTPRGEPWRPAILETIEQLAPALGPTERIAWLRLVAETAGEEEDGDLAEAAALLLPKLCAPGGPQRALDDSDLRKVRYNLSAAAQAWVQRLS